VTNIKRTNRAGTRAVASGRTGRGGASAGVTFEQVRLAARGLPGVEDSTSYGTPALKVRGKLLARLHQDGECLVLRADLLDREILLQSDPQVFFITDHYRDFPWILVRFASIDPQALPDLMERAWRLVAPKSLQSGFIAPATPPPPANARRESPETSHPPARRRMPRRLR
jgi:hypothetical protein